MKILAIFTILTYVYTGVYSQDFNASLTSAKSAYGLGNLDETRFALEQALHELDQEIGREILKLLPQNVMGASYNETDDNVVGTNLGFAGLFVDRVYQQESKQVRFQVIGDSPLLAGLNAMMALPNFVTSGGSEQKRIRVDGYKSLLQKNSSEDGNESYSIQIPANNTLISIDCIGYSENDAVAIANQIPVSQIFKLSQ